MTIRVSFLSDDLLEAAVHVRPHWIARLLGAREHDDIVSGVGGEWYWSDGRRVESGRVRRALGGGMP